MERSLLLAERCFLLLAVLTSVLASDKVPVLVWTNDPSVSFSQPLAGHSISRHEFQKSFVEHLTSDNEDNIVIFMQDKLSVSDFTSFSDVYESSEEKDSFKHVKSLMSEMSSTFLPSVVSPANVLMEVKRAKSRKVKVIDDPSDLLLSADDGPQLIIVNLPESQHSRKAFGRLDNMIGVITLQMKALAKPFIAFYTAASSSQSVFRHGQQSRRLMQAAGGDAGGDAASGTFVNVSDAFYLYYSNMSINGSAIQGLETMDNMSECNNTGSCSIALQFQVVTDSNMVFYDPKIMFQFNITTGSNAGFWYLSQLTLEYYSSPDHKELFSFEYGTDFVAQTPLGFSYHCNQPTITAINGSIAPVIGFDNFQIQPFVAEAGQFGYYNDCVGFFTIGTWMFLISSTVLLAVLSFGVIMLLNVSTMDRFDDAKGKTITVNTSDG